MAEDWRVIDLNSDPTPASPEHFRALAKKLTERGQGAQKVRERLAETAMLRIGIRLSGEYAEALDKRLTALPAEADRLVVAYQACAQALTVYAEELQQARTATRNALRQGTEADRSYRQMLGTFCEIVSLTLTGPGLWRGLNTQTAARWCQRLPPDRWQAAMQVAQRAGYWEETRQFHGRVAIQAAEFHRAAVLRCVTRIREAAPTAPAPAPAAGTVARPQGPHRGGSRPAIEGGADAQRPQNDPELDKKDPQTLEEIAKARKQIAGQLQDMVDDAWDHVDQNRDSILQQEGYQRQREKLIEKGYPE
ncbi:hypothetical protein, partial [Micromonospora sp. NPDC004551]|uniref:hypothetical protein n=1 Tax=Micromonospora sp. NPDC004551 TaxID=3154284 RepID=UPI0033A19A2D